MIMFKIAQC